jgi:hypothetical protein
VAAVPPAARAWGWERNLGYALGSLVVAAALALTARRARRVRTDLVAGCLSALVVSWTRDPDGCNVAVFPRGADPAASEPWYVVRLATVRPAVMTDAFIAGGTTPGAAMAIFTPDGDVVGVGRIRRPAKGRRVSARRHRRLPGLLGGDELDRSPV